MHDDARALDPAEERQAGALGGGGDRYAARG
jgi:hypothetical protein